MYAKRRRKQFFWCWLFVLPTTLFYAAFQAWPILSSIYYSTLDWSGISSKKTFVGLANFAELLKDQWFWNAFANSFKYMVFSVPPLIIISLLLALIVNEKTLRFRGAFRTLFFLPVITTASIVGIIMQFIWTWNSFLMPLVLTLSQPNLRTLAVGLYALQGEHVVDWTGIAAGATISVLPVILVFIAMQKHFVNGIAGAVKS